MFTKRNQRIAKKKIMLYSFMVTYMHIAIPLNSVENVHVKLCNTWASRKIPRVAFMILHLHCTACTFSAKYQLIIANGSKHFIAVQNGSLIQHGWSSVSLQEVLVLAWGDRLPPWVGLQNHMGGQWCSILSSVVHRGSLNTLLSVQCCSSPSYPA